MPVLWIHALYLLLLATACHGHRRLPASRARVAALALILGAFTLWVSQPVGLLGDYFKAYYPAGVAIAHHGFTPSLYDEGVQGFVNLPIVAVLFAPFALLGKGVSGLVFSLFGVVVAVAAWAGLVRAARLDAGRATLLLVLFAANGPLHYSGKVGNTSHLVLALLIAAFLLLRKGRDGWAGALIGISALIKPPLLLLGFYFILRQRWRAALGGGTTIAAVGLVSILWLGWQTHVVWYRQCIAPFSGNPIGAFNVQSIHAWLHRWGADPGALHDWSATPLSPGAGALAMTAVSALYAVCAYTIWRAARGLRSAGISESGLLEAEYVLIIVLATITSPVSWTHYYVWMLLPIAFWLGRHPYFYMEYTRWMMWASVVVLSLPVLRPPADGFVWEQAAVRTFSSHYLYGALLLTCGLLAGMRHTSLSSILRPAGVPVRAA